MKRRTTQYVLYAVVLREHPEVVKLGMTTKWQSRRNEYDSWNFANGDGIGEGAVYRITEEYVDLRGLEVACLDAIGFKCPRHKGNEWFKGCLQDARDAIEGVLNAAQLTFDEIGIARRG